MLDFSFSEASYWAAIASRRVVCKFLQLENEISKFGSIFKYRFDRLSSWLNH